MKYHLTPIRMATIKRTNKQTENIVLERIWRNWNTSTPSVEMLNGAAAIEGSMEIPQKIKNRITI